MLGVVVMLLALHPRVGQMQQAGLQAVGRAGLDDLLGQRLDRELLGELIEDAILAFGGRVLEGEPRAGHRVPDAEEAARLPALAVARSWQPECGLAATAV